MPRTLTLDRKFMNLRRSVAMPTQDNWQLLLDDPKEIKHVIGLLNAQLLIVLNKAKADVYTVSGQLHRDLMKRMTTIARKYPHAGIFDSEGKQTMALFFALNYDATIYDYIRY